MAEGDDSGGKERALRGCFLACGVLAGVCAVLFIAVVVTVVIFAWRYRDTARAEHLRQIDAIRAAGDPLTLRDLAPEAVPDAENAAVLLDEAFALLVRVERDDPAHETYRKTGWPDGSTADERAEMYRGLLVPNEAALAKAREAVKRPKCRFDLDYGRGFEMEMPHLADMREIARVLDMSAYREFDAGRADAAMSEMDAALRLGRLLEGEPTLISQLVRIAIHGIACNRLEPLVTSGRVSEEALRRTEKLLASCPNRGALVRAMKGERAMGGSISLADLLREEGAAPEAIATAGVLFRPFADKNKAAYYAYMAKMIAAMEEPHWEGRRKLEKLECDLGRDMSASSPIAKVEHLLVGLLAPALGRATEQDARGEAQVTVARLGCLAEIYRIRHGSPPSDLGDLVPEVTGELPRDPFTGKGYLYRVKEDGSGYVIYSVGSDGEDDGGVWHPDRPGKRDWETGDIVFEK